MSSAADAESRNPSSGAPPSSACNEVLPPAPARLLAAVAAARGFTWTESDELHDALCEYVDALRASGVDVVQVLLTVKKTLTHLPPSLLEQSVKWCIERYYASD